MRQTRFGPAILALAFLAAFGLTADAATIYWGAPTSITNDGDISLNGTLAHAGTWGSGASSVTLGSETIAFGNRPINSTDGWAGATANGENGNGGYFANPGGVGAGFETVLDSFAYDGANPKLITLEQLTPGNDYQVQMFVSDDRGCCGNRTQQWNDPAPGGPSATFKHNASTFTLGHFTADGTTQTIQGRGVGQSQNIVNGYVLRDVTGLPIVDASGVPNPNFPSLRFWVDADDASTFTLSGNNVTAWQDKSYNGIVASRAGTGAEIARRTDAINGHATVDFTGDNILNLSAPLVLPASPAGTGSSVFVVAKTTDISGNDTLMSTNINRQFFRQNGNQVRLYNGQGSDPIISGADDPITSDRLRYAQFTGGTANTNGLVQYYVNGDAKSVANSGNHHTVGWKLTSLGGRPSGGCCGNWVGDIAEVMIFDRQLTNAEQHSVGAYLGDKYGLTTGYVDGWIQPIGVSASSFYGDGQHPTNVINGSGLSSDNAAGTHSASSGAAGMWHASVGHASGGGAPVVDNQWFVFTLPGTYNLDEAYFWNHNQKSGGGDMTSRGINQYDLLVSSDGVNWTPALSDANMAKAPGGNNNNAVGVELKSFATQDNVRFVKIDIDSAHSGLANDYVGLSEIRFAGTKVASGPALSKEWAATGAALSTPVSGTDLLEGLTPTSSLTGGNLLMLGDGIGSNDFGHRVIASDDANPWILTYDLGLAPAEFAEIEALNVYTYNTDARNHVDFDVETSSDGGSTWEFLFIGANNFNPPNSNVALASLTAEDGGPLAPDVTNLRFTFRPVWASSRHSALVEIDAIGAVRVPEPSSLVLAAFGLLGLLVFSRRRAKGE